MQKLMLANYSLKLRPMYGPFHRDMLNTSWLTESIKNLQKSGYFMFQKVDGIDFVPVLNGKPERDLPEDFELISFFSTLENFIVYAFGLHDKHYPPIYSDKPVWINLESINFNIREFFSKLLDFEITGYMIVENRIRLIKAHVLLQKGMPVWVSYADKKQEEALKELLQDISQHVSNIKVYELSEELLFFLASEPKLAGFYEGLDAVPFKSFQGQFLLVSVSPERYGYNAYMGEERLYSEGFEEDAHFYEVYIPANLPNTLEPINALSMLEGGQRLRIVKYDPDQPILYFCPACWSVISKDDKICPNCGYDLTEFHELPYEYKLIMALEHPVKDMKKNVIYTIGRKGLEMALPHLEVMINKETDPIILMEIADALNKMSSPEALRLLRLLAQHRYPVVRSKANIYLYRRLGTNED